MSAYVRSTGHCLSATFHRHSEADTRRLGHTLAGECAPWCKPPLHSAAIGDIVPSIDCGVGHEKDDCCGPRSGAFDSHPESRCSAANCPSSSCTNPGLDSTVAKQRPARTAAYAAQPGHPRFGSTCGGVWRTLLAKISLRHPSRFLLPWRQFHPNRSRFPRTLPSLS